ncbi:MAG: hypothetical protein IIV97_00315 [Oscillospiraceae bacterium]|nr:hypothetical protein [Oscillospiraceae bacterium]
MNNRLLKCYRMAYEQCFVPIFVRDAFDTETLLRGCELAGVNAVEYTLRRPDAAEVIPTLRKRWPDRALFVGSMLDSDKITLKLREKQPQLMTFSELCEVGVDGFVSMLPFSDETLCAYSAHCVMIPSAATPGEALRQVDAGAHIIKLMGSDRDLRKACHAAPTHGFCPIFVTGGVTPERMPEIYADGAVLTASGFDLILKDIDPEALTAELVAEKLKFYIDSAKAARAATLPGLQNTENRSDEEWLGLLPHYHPFG